MFSIAIWYLNIYILLKWVCGQQQKQTFDTIVTDEIKFFLSFFKFVCSKKTK